MDAKAVVPKPLNLSLDEAGSVGVPFVTAWERLNRAGLPAAHESLLVLGANGKVGQACTQIATMRGALVFAVVRSALAYEGHASGPVRVIDQLVEDVAQVVRA